MSEQQLGSIMIAAILEGHKAGTHVKITGEHYEVIQAISRAMYSDKRVRVIIEAAVAYHSVLVTTKVDPPTIIDLTKTETNDTTEGEIPT